MSYRSSPVFESLFNAVRLRLLFHGYIRGVREWDDPQGRPMNRLYFFLKGKAEMWEGSKRHFLRPGRIYLFPLNRPYRFHGPAIFEKWFFDFRAEIFPGWDLFEKTPSGISIPLAGNPTAARFLRSFRSETVESLVEATGLLWQILSRFVRLDFKEFQKRTLLGQRYAPLKAVMEGKPHHEVRLGEAADRMGMSLSSLSKRFKKDTGLSLDRYVAHDFVERAKIQLLLTDLKVREVAEVLGFNSEFYFSRFFRRHAGRSPSEYREWHRPEKEK